MKRIIAIMVLLGLYGCVQARLAAEDRPPVKSCEFKVYDDRGRMKCMTRKELCRDVLVCSDI